MLYIKLPDIPKFWCQIIFWVTTTLNWGLIKHFKFRLVVLLENILLVEVYTRLRKKAWNKFLFSNILSLTLISLIINSVICTLQLYRHGHFTTEKQVLHGTFKGLMIIISFRMKSNNDYCNLVGRHWQVEELRPKVWDSAWKSKKPPKYRENGDIPEDSTYCLLS